MDGFNLVGLRAQILAGNPAFAAVGGADVPPGVIIGLARPFQQCHLRAWLEPVAHVVAQAGHEIGIRMALGAGRGAVIRQVTMRSMRPVAVGAVLGTLAGGAVARLLAGLLYGVSAGDPANYFWTLGALLAAGLLASVGPAVRAARTHPAIALRSE